MESFNNLFPKGLLMTFLVKMLIVTTSYSDMGIILGLTGIVALQIYLEKQKSIKDIQESVFKKVDEQNIVITKQNQLLEQFAIEFTKVKNDVSGVKLRSDFQQNGFGKPKAV